MAIDAHATGSADGPSAGASESEGIVDGFPDLDQSIQDALGWFRVQLIFLKIAHRRIGFGIESSDADCCLHQLPIWKGCK